MSIRRPRRPVCPPDGGNGLTARRVVRPLSSAAMAGIDPRTDPRGARWESRLGTPVLVAALLAIPTVVLYFSAVDGPLLVLATVLAWSIWLVFVAEAVIMVAVVRDRWAWVCGHWFGLAIVVATFPLLTHILEGLLAARALTGVQGVRVLQVLYLAKAAKIVKSVLIVRRRGGRGARHPVAASLVWLVGAATVVGIGHRIATGEKHATPFHNLWDLLEAAPPASLGVTLVGGAVVTAVLLRRRRRRILAASGVAGSPPGPVADAG